jgi:hypothetical protein
MEMSADCETRRVSRREIYNSSLNLCVLREDVKDDHEVGGMIQITEVAASSRKPER